jgi:potassium-transporting ATPase KdpC subunit
VTRLAARSALAVVIFTVALGLVLPAVFTGFARVVFPDKSNGSLIERNGQVVGSKLVAQKFTSPRYFHPRPSAVDYDAAGTSFANLGPTNPDLAKAVRQRAQAILKLEGPYNPGLTIGRIPVDAVTTSGSGIDPDISEAYANLQAARIAEVRGLAPARVQQLIGDNTDGRSLGFLGEPGVNVLKLNLALDRERA